MFKYIITAIIIALFAGCSAPKAKRAPLWYTTLPKDFNFIYATAASTDEGKAKKLAIASLRTQINQELNSAFENRTSKLMIESKKDIPLLEKSNEYLANTLSMRAVKIDKTAVFKGQTLILVKFSRKSLFDALSRSLNKRLPVSKKTFQDITSNVAIKRFVVIQDLMKNYGRMASLIEAKKVAIPSYSTYDEFTYLNELKKSYTKLKHDITLYVLSDVNSRAFTPAIKNALRGTGLLLSSKSESKDALKVLITSKTTNSQNYSFNQAKSLVKFTTYDINKKQVAFKQHTFIGKSRKSHKEAKQQSALHVSGKIRKLGIFNFLGLDK